MSKGSVSGADGETPAGDDDSRRWDALAEDLVGQAAELAAVELRYEADEITRAELSSVSLADRFRGARGRQVRIEVRGAGPVRGELLDTGATWVSVVDETSVTLLLLLAVLSAEGLGVGVGSKHAESAVQQGRGPGHALRAHARNRARVLVVLQSGEALSGTVDMVGADHLEIAVHPADEPRRRSAVTARRVVPFSALALVRTDRTN